MLFTVLCNELLLGPNYCFVSSCCRRLALAVHSGYRYHDLRTTIIQCVKPGALSVAPYTSHIANLENNPLHPLSVRFSHLKRRWRAFTHTDIQAVALGWAFTTGTTRFRLADRAYMNVHKN